MASSPTMRPPSSGSTYCALFALLLAGGTLAAGLGLSIEEGQGRRAWLEPVRLTVLHTNDMHGRVLGGEPNAPTGLVALGRTIRQERDRARAEGQAVLLLDAGDMWKGSLTADLTDGEVLAAWMNHLDYDAAVLGNHEFDHGVEVARRLVGQAAFPILGANIIDDATGRTAAWVGGTDPGGVPGQVVLRTIEQGGARIRVGIIGITTRETRKLTVEGATEGLSFADEAETLGRILDSLPTLDLVIVLSHAGVETDRLLAERFKGRVHVIVGGHTHTLLPKGERVAGVLICQAGDYARFLGRIRLQVHPPGAPKRVTAEATLIPAGDDLQQVLDPYQSRAAERGQQVVGQLVGNLRRALRRSSSSALGNLQTDLMRKATGAELAFQNKTGIRADLAPGQVRFRDVYAVSPFGNFPVAMNLTGAQVLELCENMLNEGTRYMLEVSGARVTFDSSRAKGSRLISVEVGGKPIDPARTYRVATNNYLAAGKDSHTVFGEGTQRTSSKKLMRDLLREFLQRNNPYDPPPIDSRLIDRAQ